MIDTVMALWNQNSRNRGVRIFFTSSLICLSLSLLLVTIVIPGWILFTQNNESTVTASIKNNAQPTSLTASTGNIIPTPTQIPVVNSNPAGTFCVTPTPHAAPEQNARIQEVSGQKNQAKLPLLPTAIALKKHAEALSQSHTVYSGRPGGSMTHLQAPSEKSSPTLQETRRIFAKATAVSSLPYKKATAVALLPHIRLSGANQNANSLFSRVPPGSEPVEIGATPVITPSLSAIVDHLRQNIVNECVPDGQSATEG